MTQWEDSDPGLSLDKRLRLLSNRFRRRLLLELLETERIEESDAVERVLEDGDDAESLVVQLYHVHLPMLAGESLIEWSEADGTVARGEQYAEVRPMLEWFDGDPDLVPDARN